MKQIVVVLDKPEEKEINISLKKKGEKVSLLGLVLGRRKGEYGLKITMGHEASKTWGEIKVVGIAEKGAKVRVTGKVRMGKKIVEGENSMKMKLLMLDEKSQVTVLPEFEIESDEVKASHGVSVGEVDEEQILYLTNRGIGREKAKELVVRGFLRKIVEQILSREKRKKIELLIAGK